MHIDLSVVRVFLQLRVWLPFNIFRFAQPSGLRVELVFCCLLLLTRPPKLVMTFPFRGSLPPSIGLKDFRFFLIVRSVSKMRSRCFSRIRSMLHSMARCNKSLLMVGTNFGREIKTIHLMMSGTRFLANFIPFMIVQVVPSKHLMRLNGVHCFPKSLAKALEAAVVLV